MTSVIIFIIIAYLIKRGVVDGHGFNDISKILGVIALIAFVISLIKSPLFWIALFGMLIVGIVALVIYLVSKSANKERAEKYGWDTEEYQRKYSEAVEKFKEIYKKAREAGSTANMSATERRQADLDDERRARESAAAEVEAEFRKRAQEQAAQSGTAAETASKTKKSGKSGTGKASGATASAGTSSKQQTVVKSKILPKSSARRTKIVRKFNEQYNLYLTDEQIKRIVDASYMSNAWKREVEAMSKKYDSVYQWLGGETAYLRAYLRAFTVQDVTSDFKQQMQIVMDSFEEVFEYSDEYSALTIDQRIEKINHKFMTSFDEITYMIAYRYLETLGLHHELQETQLNRMDGTFDDLVHKYDQMSEADVDAELKEAGTVQSDGTGTSTPSI